MVDIAMKSYDLPKNMLKETRINFVEIPPSKPTSRPGPRKSIPLTPRGDDVRDDRPSSPVSVHSAETLMLRMTSASEDESAETLVLVVNSVLDSAANNNSASSTGEPSLAVNRDVVFYTGNWYAALSTDGGRTFKYVDPFSSFPDPPDMSFCCDQIVHYIPSIDTFVWLLQYTENSANENIQRLAFATTNDIVLGRWRYYDIEPTDIGLPNTFLDFPDVAVGSGFLYVTTNGFGQNGSWSSTICVRISIDSIRTNNITAQYVISKPPSGTFNFRVAQNCGTRAFWASHFNTSKLRIYYWDETQQNPQFKDINVARWSASDYSSKTPDNFNWLGRSDPRVLGATFRKTSTGDELWFAWNAGRGGINNRPHPYAQIARIKVDGDNFTLLENINLWDANFAIAYAALATNAEGEIGTSYTFGGNMIYPSHAVGILTNAIQHVTAASGKHGPSGERWGDYLTARPCNPNTKLFAASGYTLENGTGRRDGSPRFVVFGRNKNTQSTPPPNDNLQQRIIKLEQDMSELRQKITQLENRNP